jgi:hypothetical protein
LIFPMKPIFLSLYTFSFSLESLPRESDLRASAC